MKKPTNRSFIFLVVRDDSETSVSVPIASFLTQEAADNYAGTCAQEFEDRGIEGYSFNTQCIIYYND